MQTFLPSSYSFSLNQLSNFNGYQNSVTNKIITNSIISILLGLMAGIIAASFLRAAYDNHKHSEADNSITITTLFFAIGMTVACVMILCFSFVPMHYNDWHTEAFIKQDFHYPVANSNLVIKCISTDNRTTNIPQSIHDSEKYPYKLYVKQANSKYYLGTMKNDIFKPAKTYTASVFYQYIQYIQDHHLENKFNQHMYFTQNSKYIDRHKVQWILTNNHDIDLHLVDNTSVKKSKVTTN